MEQARVRRLSLEEAVATAHEWAPLLQRSIEASDGLWTWEQCATDICGGVTSVWTVGSRAVFTTRLLMARERYVLVEDMAGDGMAEWLPAVVEAMDAYADEVGASTVIVEGRRGWERELREYGYAPHRVQLVKRINP